MTPLLREASMVTPAPIRVFVLAVVGCMIGACATPGARQWRGPQGQLCMEVPSGNLPAEDAFSYLLAGAAHSETRTRAPADTLLVIASYDTSGVLRDVAAYGKPGDPPAPDDFTAELRPRFAASGPARSTAYALYLAEGEPDLRPHQPHVECEPSVLNRRFIQDQLAFLARDPRAFEKRVVAWLFVGADGNVVSSLLARSSGDIGVDREMLRIAGQARFAPALQDGFTRPMWVAIPFGIEARSEFLRPGECPPVEVQSIPCYR